MGKRKSDSTGGNRNKKYKVSGFIDPNTSGIYATCNRGRELGCRKELMNILAEKIEELYPDWSSFKADDEDESTSEKPAEKSVEDEIEEELKQLKSEKSQKSVHPLLHPIELGCECLVFVKVRKPADPVQLVQSICEDAFVSKQKNTRFTQKLTPISFSVSASMDELIKLAKRVLAPEFHQEKDQTPHKFAIQVTRRNFNTLEKEDIIKTIANSVGRDHGHSVDLKEFDRLIMVECYKNNIGMSVATNFKKYEKFNLQQIFEKDMGASVSRVTGK